MTSAQNESQASHESELKKLHSEKKAVQKDLSSTKTKVRNLEEAKGKLEAEVCGPSSSAYVVISRAHNYDRLMT
jgi:predicted  nucleic acid-binding Zn-ribbon protein